MFQLTGQYNTADIFAAALEQSAVSQIMELLCQEFVRGSSIRIMPDAHAGKGCTVGTTMTLHRRVVPNLVGVDIGCGIVTRRLQHKPDFKKLDDVIRRHVPSGFNIRKSPHEKLNAQALTELKCLEAVNLNRAHLSVGTLGGGNHFIEVDVDSQGYYWLLVHSGSRNLGKQIADYYQTAAIKQCRDQDRGKEELIARLRREGRAAEISDAIKRLDIPKIPTYLAYCEGDLFTDYLHDMRIAQGFAQDNRDAIIETIDEFMAIVDDDGFTTVHNYIDETNMLRKGAVSAHLNERLVIPMNMRDGTLLCRGLGNSDWNESAPHGAGRLMSRSEAKRRLTVAQYEDSMQGIFSTCVNRGTLDEAPAAYKPMEEILAQIGTTVEVVDQWKPVYNFKAQDK